MRRGEFYEGYRLNGYDATYERTMIELVEKEIDSTRVIEMEDVNSGIRLMVSIKKGDLNDEKAIGKGSSIKKRIEDVGNKAGRVVRGHGKRLYINGRNATLPDEQRIVTNRAKSNRDC